MQGSADQTQSLPGGTVFPLMQDQTIALGIFDEQHPADGSFDRTFKHTNFALLAGRSGCANVVDCECNGRRAIPFPLGFAGPLRPIDAE